MKKVIQKNHMVIMSDEYLRESSLQGGKIIGEHIALGCFIMGIPFFIIGLYALFNMLFGFGHLINTALIIGAVLITVIGLLLIISGYSIYKHKQIKSNSKNKP